LTIDNATNDGTVPAGQFQLGAGVDQTDLWLLRSQNDLVLDVLGTQDSLTVTGWFGTNASAKLADVIGGDGARIDTAIAQLTAAMAAYQSSNPPATMSAIPTDTTLQSALAAAWYH
jgi:hypothetical protein